MDDADVELLVQVGKATSCAKDYIKSLLPVEHPSFVACKTLTGKIILNFLEHNDLTWTKIASWINKKKSTI